jgi:hypothetical protein
MNISSNANENHFSNRLVFSLLNFVYQYIDFRIKILSDNTSIVDLLTDGSNNAFITDTMHLRFLEKSLNGSTRFTVLKEIIVPDYLGLAFVNNDYMFKSVNNIISQLYESGIAELIVAREAAVKYLQIVPEDVQLSLNHLGIWFYICLFMLLAASVVFVLEFVAHKFCFRKQHKVSESRGRNRIRTLNPYQF